MRQEINLYTDEFLPKIQWCSFQHAAFIVTLFVFVLGFYSFSQYEQLLILTKENKSLMKNSEGFEEKPGQAKNLMDKIVEKRTILEGQINTLSSEVEGKKLIKGAYETEKNMSLASSYEIFFSIANQSNRNLSVSEVMIYEGGGEVLVNGYSRTKEAIPDYFKRLKKESSFSFSRFGLLTIEKLKNNGLYQFTMERESEVEDTFEKDLLDERKLSGDAKYDG